MAKVHFSPLLLDTCQSFIRHFSASTNIESLLIDWDAGNLAMENPGLFEGDIVLVGNVTIDVSGFCTSRADTCSGTCTSRATSLFPYLAGQYNLQG